MTFTVGDPSLIPLVLSLEEQFDRDLFPGLLAARTRARRERLSFYFPFIAVGEQRVGDDVISSGEGSREPEQPAGAKRIAS